MTLLLLLYPAPSMNWPEKQPVVPRSISPRHPNRPPALRLGILNRQRDSSQ